MARVFITGSADGLGLLAARMLVKQGHQVVLHARNEERGRQALAREPGALAVLTADLSDLEKTKELANKVNALAPFDAIIHNAGVYHESGSQIFAVNTLAPYILTCLINRPRRLIYISSGMHLSGQANLEQVFQIPVPATSYSDSKLHALLLSKAVARKWSGVYSNAVDPGWVPTKMGGAGAPDDLQKGAETQVWLAVSGDVEAQLSGRYYFHQKEARYSAQADNTSLQDQFLRYCEQISGVAFPTR